MIGFDILDSTKSKIERCIKVEFTGESILLCDYESSTLVFMFKADASDSEVTEYRKVGASPADLAGKAAEWIVNEFSKNPIFARCVLAVVRFWSDLESIYKIIKSVSKTTLFETVLGIKHYEKKHPIYFDKFFGLVGFFSE
jgi:hypothetical protein